jgi:hypothetical protein
VAWYRERRDDVPDVAVFPPLLGVTKVTHSLELIPNSVSIAALETF